MPCAANTTPTAPGKPTSDWARRYILFHNTRHPAEMGAPEIQQFLAHLAHEQNASASTQNQALSALLPTAKRPQHLSTVLSPQKIRLALGQGDGKRAKTGSPDL